MPREHRYRVGVFEVVLTKSGEEEVHPWDDTTCECEDYHDRLKNPRIKTPEDHRCRHIREAMMYHHFARRVERLGEEQTDEQTTIGTFAVPGDG